MREQIAARVMRPLGAVSLFVLAACSSGDPGSPNQGSGGGGSGGASAEAGGSNFAGAAAGATAMAGAGAMAGSGGAAGSAGAAGSGGGGGVAAGGAGGTDSGDLVYPAAAGAGDVNAGIEQLNLYRATLGFDSVTLDAPSSVGCEGHLQYLMEEAEKLGQNGYLEHTETDHDNSHYSPENEQAGKDSDLAWGQSGGKAGSMGQSLGQAVDLWINGLYHRHPLLNPGLVKVGAASIDGYNCLNYNAAGNTNVVKPPAPILWPAAGMTDVPRAFGGNEGPCPTNPADPLAGGSCAGSGFIPSATFYNWGSNRAKVITAVASATLTNVMTEADVPLLTWYADNVSGHDPAHGYMLDEVSLVPASSLASGTLYRVDVDAEVNGAQTMLSWSFTTGTRNQ